MGVKHVVAGRHAGFLRRQLQGGHRVKLALVAFIVGANPPYQRMAGLYELRVVAQLLRLARIEDA